MKRTQTILIITIIVSVFLLSFLIGRATALRDREENGGKTQIYNGTVHIPNKTQREESMEASNSVQKVPKESLESEKELNASPTGEKPPEKMLFPCGEKVLKEYSQMAVYSETMGDWRAHTGIDYENEMGTEVVSCWDGKVTKIYTDKLWGHTVEIQHSGNVKSVYKNLDSKIKVRKGDKIKGGQVIGQVGDSAAVESREKPHLHFEVWQDGVVINPTSYVY